MEVMMQANQQPNQQEAAQQPENQKAFADLLYTMMNVIEQYQEGENGEGNYLIAMNALRDLHKFKQQLVAGGGGVVYHHYLNMARAAAPPPARQRAQRKKLSEEEKRAAGYVCCPKCGRLFSENSKLTRHQETTEICRHITHEKQVAIATKQTERKMDTKTTAAVTAAGGKMRKMAKIQTQALITPPDDRCLHFKHPFFGSFVHSLMLFVETREQEVKYIATSNNLAMYNALNGTSTLKEREQIYKTNYYDAYMHNITIEGKENVHTIAMI
jgi:hypothetical protein